MAPMKGNINSRIRFGHLLGGGFRHSSRGSGFFLGGKSDMHLRGDRMNLLRYVFCRIVCRGV
jgi:hypothetical protein